MKNPDFLPTSSWQSSPDDSEVADFLTRFLRAHRTLPSARSIGSITGRAAEIHNMGPLFIAGLMELDESLRRDGNSRPAPEPTEAIAPKLAKGQTIFAKLDRFCDPDTPEWRLSLDTQTQLGIYIDDVDNTLVELGLRGEIALQPAFPLAAHVLHIATLAVAVAVHDASQTTPPYAA